MAGERGVVGLDVHLEVLLQAVLVQEADDRLSVVVILVGRRLSSLGLDGELGLKANLLLVVHCHLQEACHVIQLCLHLRVQGRGEALAATPEDVGLTPELLAHLQHLPRLRLKGSRGALRHEGTGRSLVSLVSLSSAPSSTAIGEGIEGGRRGLGDATPQRASIRAQGDPDPETPAAPSL